MQMLGGGNRSGGSAEFGGGQSKGGSQSAPAPASMDNGYTDEDIPF
jgi:hypothetical protein